MLDSAKTKAAILRRLDSFMRCGHSVMVRTCECCGGDRPGSGSYAYGTRTCKTRACATCAWTRAQNTSRFMEDAFDLVAPADGYRWQFVTLTTRYDPTNPADLTVAALRSRALLSAKLARWAWNEQLGVKGAGMLRTTEVSARGHVHANLIYYGPAVDKVALDALLSAHDCRAGFCDVRPLTWDPVPGKPGERVESEDPRGSKEAVKRAARYASKGLAHAKEHTFDEEWLAGQRTAKVVDEILAARWEIAVYRLQLSQRYGALRGLKYEEHARIAPEDDSDVACRRCGVVGLWKSARRRAEEWLQWCHDQGEAGLEHSRWTPRAREGPDYCR